MTEFSLDFPYNLGKPESSANFRVCNEDFIVHEELGFTPAGEGEHVLLQLEKNGENTAWIARQIALLAKVFERDIGYCGRKDRHAITRQWFSVYLPKGPEPDWEQLHSPTTKLLKAARHTHKLRRGQHLANHFVIRLRNVSGQQEPLNQRLKQVMSQGVPNYFGEQRFGRQCSNLALAAQLLEQGVRIKDRQKKGFALSAARSYLFNLVLAERVRTGLWHQSMEGEVESDNAEPNAPLWGRGRLQSSGALRTLEDSVLEPWKVWCERLEYQGLKQERRSTMLTPVNGAWTWENNDLILNFSLPVGTFATSVIRELVITHAIVDASKS